MAVDERVYFGKGRKGGDIAAAEKINGNLRADLGNRKPRWRIFSTCPMLIWELGKLRYADWSGTAQQHKNFREEIVDRDNHSWDDFKMFLNGFFAAPQRSAQDEKLERLKYISPASYREWNNVKLMHQRWWRIWTPMVFAFPSRTRV